MNDRLKFRVFDVENKKYSKGFQVNQNGELCSEEDSMPENEITYIIEQCTGIKDKNGKLIYKGDYLEITSDKWFEKATNMVVFYDNEWLEWKVKCLTPYEDTSIHYEGSLGSGYIENIKIIGNIHEKDVK